MHLMSFSSCTVDYDAARGKMNSAHGLPYLVEKLPDVMNTISSMVVWENPFQTFVTIRNKTKFRIVLSHFQLRIHWACSF